MGELYTQILIQRQIDRAKPMVHRLIRFLKPSKKTVALVAVVVAMTLLVSVSISIWLQRSYNIYLPSIATIETIGVKAFWDQNLTSPVETINWGTLYPGSSSEIAIYLQSESNVPVRLGRTEENWTFSDSHDMKSDPPANIQRGAYIEWDYGNTTIAPEEVIRVGLTLTVDSSSEFVGFLISNEVTHFSFEMLIYGVLA